MFILRESAESDAQDTFKKEQYEALKKAGYEFIKTIWGRGSDGANIKGWLVQRPDRTKKEISFEKLKDLADDILSSKNQKRTKEVVFSDALAALRRYDSNLEVSPGVFRKVEERPFLTANVPGIEKYGKCITTKTIDLRNLKKPTLRCENNSLFGNENILYSLNVPKYIKMIDRLANDDSFLKRNGGMFYAFTEYPEVGDFLERKHIVEESIKINSSGLKNILEDLFEYNFKVAVNKSENLEVLLEKFLRFITSKKESLNHRYAGEIDFETGSSVDIVIEPYRLSIPVDRDFFKALDARAKATPGNSRANIINTLTPDQIRDAKEIIDTKYLDTYI